MFDLILFIAISSGNGASGGPIVIPDFKTESACVAYADTIKRSIPSTIDVGSGWNKLPVSYPIVRCIKRDLK